jgi:hypothetical protein
MKSETQDGDKEHWCERYQLEARLEHIYIMFRKCTGSKEGKVSDSLRGMPILLISMLVRMEGGRPGFVPWRLDLG